MQLYLYGFRSHLDTGPHGVYTMRMDECRSRLSWFGRGHRCKTYLGRWKIHFRQTHFVSGSLSTFLFRPGATEVSFVSRSLIRAFALYPPGKCSLLTLTFISVFFPTDYAHLDDCHPLDGLRRTPSIGLSRCSDSVPTEGNHAPHDEKFRFIFRPMDKQFGRYTTLERRSWQLIK